MVDAVTQTERSDYYTLKMRALKRQLKQQKVESPNRRGEHLVKLRIANIQLHDSSAAAGPKSGSLQPHPALVQHGPTVADFAAVFSPAVTVQKSQPQVDWKKKQQLNSTGYALHSGGGQGGSLFANNTHTDNRPHVQKQVHSMVVGQKQGSNAKVTAQMNYTTSLHGQATAFQ